MELSQSQQSDKMKTACTRPILGQMNQIEYGDTLVSLVTPTRPQEGVARCEAKPHFPGQSRGMQSCSACFVSGKQSGVSRPCQGTGEDTAERAWRDHQKENR